MQRSNRCRCGRVPHPILHQELNYAGRVKLQQLDLERERGVRWDRRRRSHRAVAELGRSLELDHLAHLHGADGRLPRLDDAALPKRELEDLLFPPTRVEDRAVLERAHVVHRDRVAWPRVAASAHPLDRLLQLRTLQEDDRALLQLRRRLEWGAIVVVLAGDVAGLEGHGSRSERVGSLNRPQVGSFRGLKGSTALWGIRVVT